MTDRREREDGIAANQFVNALIIMREMTSEDRQSVATAFLAGAAHVRNSAEWKAADKVIALARIYCDPATTGFDVQEAFTDLRDALRKFNRLRGEERG